MLLNRVAIRRKHVNSQLNHTVTRERIRVVITAMCLRIYPTRNRLNRVEVNTFLRNQLTLAIRQITEMQRV